MTLYAKPAVRNSWAQTAAAADIQDPGNTFASGGYPLGAKPPRQYMNWVLNYVSNAVRYFCQQGVPQWDATETYPAYSLSQGTNTKVLCYSLLANNTTNPEAAGSMGNTWDVPYVPQAGAGDRTVRIANTAWVGTYFLPVGSTFNAINGQLLNAQVPVGAVTQWQGSLSIAGSQVSSAVAQANSVLFVGSGYGTFNWSAGGGSQPSWLWGSNNGITSQVWNPSNFSVANSQALQGLTPTTAAAGNSIAARDANGYIAAGYFTQGSSNNENGTISQVMVNNGGDGFLRKAAFSYFAQQLINQNAIMVLANFASSLATNGYMKFPGGLIIQWGSVFAAGLNPTQVGVTWPTAFVSQCFTAYCNTLRATGGQQGSNFVQSVSRTGGVFVFDNVASPANTVGGYFFAIGT